MDYNFLYIDDAETSSLQSLAGAIAGSNPGVSITVRNPDTFEDLLGELMRDLGGFGGLILDWKLDERQNTAGTLVSYKAAALAQELRTRASEGLIKDVPVVLWSTHWKLVKSFHSDKTSHDLFDHRYEKDTLGQRAETVRRELHSLASGYDAIRMWSTANVGELLGLPAAMSDLLDPRITGWLSVSRPVHESARFILNELVLAPGLLLDEPRIAARLGIDIARSEQWTDLVRILPAEATYAGPFHEGWPRWWSSVIEKSWWRTLVNGDVPPLSVLPADKRVQIIRERTELDGLEAAFPLVAHYSNRYSTVCEVTGRPLDAIDGVMVDEREPLPWQQHRYISLDAVLQRTHTELDIEIHPSEAVRINSIRRRHRPGAHD